MSSHTSVRAAAEKMPTYLYISYLLFIIIIIIIIIKYIFSEL
jgi:hypothetical protein